MTHTALQVVAVLPYTHTHTYSYCTHASSAARILTRTTHTHTCHPVLLYGVQVSLPPQMAMFACIYSMHRDPGYWPHALDFRPERWLPVSAAWVERGVTGIAQESCQLLHCSTGIRVLMGWFAAQWLVC